VIVDGILGLLYGIIGPVIDALPTGSLPSVAGTAWNTFAQWIWSVDALVPIAAPMQFMLGVVIATVPAFLTYRIAVFVYNKIRGS